MINKQIAIGAILLLVLAPSLASAQTIINPIPSGLHKCIDLAVGIYGFSVGLNATMGKFGIKQGTDNTVKEIEGCVKGAYLKLFPDTSPPTTVETLSPNTTMGLVR